MQPQRTQQIVQQGKAGTQKQRRAQRTQLLADHKAHARSPEQAAE